MRLPFLLRLSFLLLFAAAVPNRAAATVRYSISLSDRAQHRFGVRMVIPGTSETTELDMPVWNALYQVREFASRMVSLHAANSSGAAVSLRRITPHSWMAGPAAGSLVVEYAIEWDDPGPFSSQLNDSHAFLNCATILLYSPVHRAEDVSLEFRDVPEGWRMATALDSGKAPNSFVAANYDDLVQAPIEAGAFTEFTIQVAGRPISIVVHAAEAAPESVALWSREHLEDVARRLVETEAALMGDAPFPHYLFILHLGIGGGGGMEHPNSTAISVGQGQDPAGIMAHELFHAWNVLRIRPRSLEPVDYEHEQPTDALWFAEGVTSTIGAYALVRSGLWTREQFYRDLAAQIEQLEARPAHRFQSAEDSSIATWLDNAPLYGRGENSISYYNKGQLLGVCLDIILRDATANRESLDTLLRALNTRYAQKHIPYGDSAAIEALATELAHRDLSSFFSPYVAGTEEIPFKEILARGGFDLRKIETVVADVGFTAFRPGPGGVAVTAVEPGGPAEAAGLKTGDTIAEFNGAPAPPRLGRLLARVAPGDELRLGILRGGAAQNISFHAGRRSATTQSVVESDSNPLARAIREGIVTGKSSPSQ